MPIVLVADDDPGFRALIRYILEGAGHHVLMAGSAVEVFEQIDAQRPDVILLDVHLGADDGLAIGAGLRREQRLRDTQVLFMTGTLDSAELVSASRRFRAAILEKPFTASDLLSAIGRGDSESG